MEVELVNRRYITIPNQFETFQLRDGQAIKIYSWSFSFWLLWCSCELWDCFLQQRWKCKFTFRDFINATTNSVRTHNRPTKLLFWIIHISFIFLLKPISEGRIDFSTRENLFRVEFSRATNRLRAEKRFLCENRPRSRPYCCLRWR